MATVRILISKKFIFAFGDDALKQVRHNYLAGNHVATPYFEVKGEGEAAAEEVFDLTNNPSRQEEREEKYGRGPSLSSGDIVEMKNGELWACMSIGWKRL